MYISREISTLDITFLYTTFEVVASLSATSTELSIALNQNRGHTEDSMLIEPPLWDSSEF